MAARQFTTPSLCFVMVMCVWRLVNLPLLRCIVWCVRGVQCAVCSVHFGVYGVVVMRVWRLANSPPLCCIVWCVHGVCWVVCAVSLP